MERFLELIKDIKLTEGEKNTLIYRFYHRCTLKECKYFLHKSIERFRQLEASALKKIRRSKYYRGFDYGIKD